MASSTDIQILVAQLQQAVAQKEHELAEKEGQFQALKEDFAYNVQLIDERDQELSRYELAFPQLQQRFQTQETELTEMRSRCQDAERRADALQLHFEESEKDARERIDALRTELEARTQSHQDAMRSIEDVNAKQQLAFQRRQRQAEDNLEAMRREFLAASEDALRRERNDGEARASTLADEAARARSAAHASEQRIYEAAHEIERLNGEIVRMQDALTNAEKDAKQARWDLEDSQSILTAQLREAENEREQLAAKTRQLESEVQLWSQRAQALHQVDIPALNQRIADATTERDTLIAELTQAREEIQALGWRVEEQTAASLALGEKAKQSESFQDKQNENLASARAEIAQLRSDVKARDAVIASQRNELTTAARYGEQVTLQRDQAIGELSRYRGTGGALFVLMEEQRLASAVHRALAMHAGALEHELAGTRDAHQESAGHLALAMQEIDASRQRESEALRSAQELQMQLAEQNATHTKMLEALGAMQSAMQETAADQSDAQRARTENLQLHAVISTHGEETALLQARITQLEGQLNEANTRAAQRQSDGDTLRDANQRLRAALGASATVSGSQSSDEAALRREVARLRSDRDSLISINNMLRAEVTRASAATSSALASPRRTPLASLSPARSPFPSVPLLSAPPTAASPISVPHAPATSGPLASLAALVALSPATRPLASSIAAACNPVPHLAPLSPSPPLGAFRSSATDTPLPGAAPLPAVVVEAPQDDTEQHRAHRTARSHSARSHSRRHAHGQPHEQPSAAQHRQSEELSLVSTDSEDDGDGPGSLRLSGVQAKLGQRPTTAPRHRTHAHGGSAPDEAASGGDQGGTSSETEGGPDGDEEGGGSGEALDARRERRGREAHSRSRSPARPVHRKMTSRARREKKTSEPPKSERGTLRMLQALVAREAGESDNPPQGHSPVGPAGTDPNADAEAGADAAQELARLRLQDPVVH